VGGGVAKGRAMILEEAFSCALAEEEEVSG
jgi:hypothetical protein